MVPNVKKNEMAVGVIYEGGRRQLVVLTPSHAYIAPSGSPGIRVRKASTREIESAHSWQMVRRQGVNG